MHRSAHFITWDRDAAPVAVGPVKARLAFLQRRGGGGGMQNQSPQPCLELIEQRQRMVIMLHHELGVGASFVNTAVPDFG